MRCIFCDNELQQATTKGLLICPHCHLHVYMESKQAMFGKNSPSYLIDSQACLSTIHKYKPDLVISPVQLFQPGFNITETTMFFNRKADLGMYTTLGKSEFYHTRSELPAGNKLIAFKGIPAFGFATTLAATLQSMPNDQNLPLLTLYKANCYRYIWHMVVAANVSIYNNKFNEAVELLCSRSLYDYLENVNGEYMQSKTMEQYAFIAGLYKNTRFREVHAHCGAANCSWYNGVINYFQRCLKEADLGKLQADPEEILQELCVSIPNYDTHQYEFCRSAVEAYCESSPILAEVNSGGQVCLFNPELPGSVDTTVIDMMKAVRSGYILSTELGRYSVYGELRRQLFGTQGQYSNRKEVADLIEKGWRELA